MTTNHTILAIDTSSEITSLALLGNGNLLASLSGKLDESRSERLWSDIRSMLESVGLLVADVDAFAVCVGPGGFTGVRVGIAAVKGLASASGKPVVAVSSLEAAAFSAGPAAAVYALVKAYKGEVYAQLFSFDDLGAPVACDLPIAAGVEEALSRVSTISDLILAGSAVSEELVYGREGWRIAESHECLAEQIARLAAIKLARGETETAESLRAEYVRQSEAEIKLSKGLLGSKIRRVLGRDEIPVKE